MGKIPINNTKKTQKIMKIIVRALLLLSSLPVFAADSIFDTMDEKTAITTGISKLSDKEKIALLTWLETAKKQTLAQQKKKNMGFSAAVVDKDREEITSSIVGEFNGWQGKNVFTLANGQVWKQVEKSTFYIPKRTNPSVTVKPKALGSWSLFLDGYSRGVRVRRVK